jgi:hypothetical protein
MPFVEKAPSRFELLFGESSAAEPSSTEPRPDPADELPEALRQVVERIKAGQRERADA